MSQNQGNTILLNSEKYEIRSAIDILLSSNSNKAIETTVKLIECSPEVDVIMNKQGGICTKCNTMFKSRTALLSHPQKCTGYDGSISSDCSNTNKEMVRSPPQLVIIQP